MNVAHVLLEKNAMEDAKGYYDFSLELCDANFEAMSGLAHVELQVPPTEPHMRYKGRMPNVAPSRQ